MADLQGQLLINLPGGDEYMMIHDAYYGTGLFVQGRGLIQHPRESVENFMNRKSWRTTGTTRALLSMRW